MRKTKENAGITLIALVITIIVLLILAGISIITLTGQNGILTQANKAKQENELGEEKERAGLVSQELKIEKAQGKDVDKTGFQKMVDSQFGSSKATGDVEDSTYVIVVAKTGNIYLINEDGTIDEAGNKNDMKKDENPGVLEDLGNNTYAVNSIEDLVALSYTVNSGTDTYEGKTVTLGRSLYFNGMFDSYANPESKYEVKTKTERNESTNEETVTKLGYIPNESSTATIKELVTTGDGFTPIGLVDETNSFKGNFDGKNNYIDGLYEKSNTFAGLIGQTKGTVKISNLGIKSGTIKAGSSTGVLVGISQGNITIENCYNKSNVNAGYCSAGMIGLTFSNVDIDDCYNKGIMTSAVAGGLIGNSVQSGIVNISRSHNDGDINSGSNYNAGGIMGATEVEVNINDSYNTGNIQGNKSTSGGIIGNARENKAKITKCYNKGSVTGTTVGGITGFNGKIVDCYNTGKIESNELSGSAAGGITGRFSEQIENCYNIGKIMGGDTVGGIVAQTRNEIINCYNTGEIELRDNSSIVGGIAGQSSNISNCYNESSILGNGKSISNIAGILAMPISSETEITKSYNIGNITSLTTGRTTNVAGICGNGKVTDCYNKGDIQGMSITAGITTGTGLVSDSYNMGNIVGNTEPTAGISALGRAINCYNTGNVSGKNLTAGICYGESRNAVVGCYNTGNITGTTSPVAGIVCFGNANNCYNTGNVSGENLTAGICANGSEAINCYNKGKITGKGNPVAGIFCFGTITNCYNTGEVTGISDLVAGIMTSGNGKSCYNTGKIIGGNAPTGGISAIGTTTNCHNTGDILGSATQLMYEVGSYNKEKCTYLKKSTNARADGAEGKTGAEMKEIMDLQKFVELMNQKVEENNSNASNTKWKKWKLVNGVPVFAE